MVSAKHSNQKKENNGANVGYEAKLWQTADALRSNVDATEYKHGARARIFLKYISDAFEADLEADRKSGADPEDRDEYRSNQSREGEIREALHTIGGHKQ